MEYFDNNEQVQSRKYAFKCHRRSEAGRDLVYPVNAIAFHPVFGTFATGGKRNFVNVSWYTKYMCKPYLHRCITDVLLYFFLCLHFGLSTVVHNAHSEAIAMETMPILGSLQHLQDVQLDAAIMPVLQGN